MAWDTSCEGDYAKDTALLARVLIALSVLTKAVSSAEGGTPARCLRSPGTAPPSFGRGELRTKLKNLNFQQ